MKHYLVVTTQFIAEVVADDIPTVNRMLRGRFDATRVWFHGNRSMGPREVVINRAHLVGIFEAPAPEDDS